MPWCDSCSKYFDAASARAGDACPDCGRPLDADALGANDPVDAADTADTEGVDDEPELKIPWHFWVGVAAMVIYLGWRLIQGIIWVIG